MLTLRIKTHFDAAHRLEHYDGACNRLHGHRWEVEFFIGSKKINDNTGMVCDFKVLKHELNEMLPDHQYLNDILNSCDPTAERIVQILYHNCNSILSDLMAANVLPSGTKLIKVVLWESPECGVEYDGTN
jgi:6-pyruvoyltetrahydropterin/6-carboxytetrahydropterin synthase